MNQLTLLYFRRRVPILRTLFILGMACGLSLKDFAQGERERHVIPIGGNAWGNRVIGGRVTNEGVSDWTDPATFFTVYFRVSQAGALHVWLNLRVPSGKSRLRVTPGKGDGAGTIDGAGRKEKADTTERAGAIERAATTRGMNRSGGVGAAAVGKELDVTGVALQRCDAGSWLIRDTGYQAIRIQGIRKSGAVFAAIQSIEIQGELLKGEVAYVPNNEGNFFHWGRRGPSVHLNYPLPAEVHAEWFYNEVTVPEGQDIQGSYFMADGFGEGYFGMQVNSPTERHILFSVWSPFQTDNPRAIPDSLQILLVRKGEGVHAGAFGDEGSGGQSWLNFPWKAGNTYLFLLRGEPLEHNYTQYTAWFYASEQGKWLLIASFKRPQTQKWLTGLHSFLENFEPEMGDRQRTVFFLRQWVRDEQGNWIALDKARFSGDNTARKGYRMDYGGGVVADAFYLRNGGFFDGYTPLNKPLERSLASDNREPPLIDFTQLP